MSRPQHTSIVLLLVLLVVPAPGAAALPPFGAPQLLADFNAGPEGSTVLALAPTPNGVVFRVREDPGSGPFELWFSNGAPEGTQQLAPDRVRLVVSGDFWPTGRYVYFDGMNLETGQTGLWRTDGTPEGTIELVAGVHFGRRARSLGDRGTLVFLTESPGDLEARLWRSDGTPEGTLPLRDFLLSRFDVVGDFVEHDGAVYFLDLAPNRIGMGLWATDGTVEGTRPVYTIDGSTFRNVYATETGLYLLSVQDSDQVASLWSSDGTSEGTHQIVTLGEVDDTGFPALLLGELDGGQSVWTFETQSIERSLWASDGTAAGTTRLVDLPGVGTPTPIVGPVRGLYYLAADDGTHGRELWRTDGTPQGTELAFELGPGTRNGVADFRGLGDLVYMTTFNNVLLGLEPHVTDGTLEGLRLLGDLCPGSCSSRPALLTDRGSFAVFVASDPDETYQLWATDFTAEGTEQLADFSGGIYGVSVVRPPFLVTDNQVFFVADDGATGYELWTVPILDGEPYPPLGPWLSSDGVPGFEYKVRITGGGGPIAGSTEPTCIPETACVSGAVPGRSEVFVRIVGPRANGYLWPTLVKFSTSQVEVWIRQLSTGIVRYYRLEGARPGVDELPGLFDRMGFEP